MKIKLLMVVLLAQLILIPKIASANTYNKELSCMTEAIFKEANTESEAGKIAVAWVVMNRVKDKKNKFPKTICAVVNHSEFSYEGKDNKRRSELSKIAHEVITGKIKDNTNGSTHFHHVKKKPNWSKTYVFKVRYGKHLFYRYHYNTFQ